MAEFDIDAYLNKEDKKKGFDIDAYLAQTPAATTARKEQGKAIASLADTALNSITGGLDMAAYPLARLYYGTVGGMSPEAAAAKAQAETTSPKDVVGRAFGYTGQPSYESSPIRQLGTYAGETLGENVIQPLAQTTGLPEPDVANMVNFASLGLAPAVPKVVKPVVGAVRDVSGGAFGAATGRTAAPGVAPKPWQQASVRQPVGETYIPANVLEQYRAGAITAEQAQAAARPTSELKGLAATGGTVPYAGQGMRAFGESLGETYRNPLNIITDVGAGMLSGGPALTAGRLGYKGYQAYNANKLSNLGFTPLSSAEAAALRPGAGGPPGSGIAGPISPQAAVQEVVASPPPVANLPQLGYTPGAGSPTMYVSPEGVASTNMRAADQGGIAQKYPPLSGPVAPQTPAIVAQQAAVEKITPPTNPVQAAAQETIAQKAQRVMGDKYRAPVEQAPAPYDKAAQIKAAEASAKESFNNSTPEQNQAIRDTLLERNPDIKFTTPDPLLASKPVSEQPMAAPRVETPVNTPVLKGTEMKKEYPLTTDPKDYNKATNQWTDDYYSPETRKYMSPEERRWRNKMAANEISSTTESRQVGIEGKGKKAKPVMTDVKITSYDPASWENNIQPDIRWTSMVKENSIGREPYPTFILKGTKDGVDYTLKLNNQSAHMGDLYADINGKPTLVKQWYNDYSERSPKDWDKVQGKLGIDLEKISHPNPAHTDARGFEPEKTTKKKVASNDAMEMKTNPQTTFIDKTDFEKQKMVDTLAGEPTLGSYIDNGRLHEFELNRDYAGTPKELQKYIGPEVRERVTDLATGKIIKGEPRALTMREKLEAAKKKKGK